MITRKSTKYHDFSIVERRTRLYIAWRKRVHCHNELCIMTSAGMADTPFHRELAAQLALRVLLALPQNVRHTQDTLTDKYRELRDGLILNRDRFNKSVNKPMLLKDLWAKVLASKLKSVKESTFSAKWDGHYASFLSQFMEEPVTVKLVDSLCEDTNRINELDRYVLIKALYKQHELISGERSITNKVFAPFQVWKSERTRKRKTDEFGKRCYTVEELRIIFEYFENKRDKDLLLCLSIQMLYALGVRSGELAGLQRKHFSLLHSELEVCQQYSSELRKLTSTKTSTIRTIKLTKEHQILIVRCLKANGFGDPDTFILPLQNNPRSMTNIYDAWCSESTGIPVLIRQGVIKELLPLYSLRHAFVTHALARGNPIEAVARQSGHSVATCRQYYVDISTAGLEPLK